MSVSKKKSSNTKTVKEAVVEDGFSYWGYWKVVVSISLVGLIGLGGGFYLIKNLPMGTPDDIVSDVQLAVVDRVGTVPAGMIVVDNTAVKMPDNVGGSVEIGEDGSVNIVKENTDETYIENLKPMVNQICVKETAITPLESDILATYAEAKKISPENYCEFLLMYLNK